VDLQGPVETGVAEESGQAQDLVGADPLEVPVAVAQADRDTVASIPGAVGLGPVGLGPVGLVVGLGVQGVEAVGVAVGVAVIAGSPRGGGSDGALVDQRQ